MMDWSNAWLPMPQQQQFPPADGHEGAGHGGSGGYGGGGGDTGGGEGGSFGYDAGANPGRGMNPGRGGAEDMGPQIGGFGRDPGWDRPGGYDYGPKGDVVVKVDPVTQERTFRVFGKACDDAVEAQLADMRANNPFLGGIATLMANSIMGRAMRFTGRTFGAEIDQDGNFLGGDMRGEGGEPAANEPPPEDEEDEDEETTPEEATDQAYRDLLGRLQRGQGTTAWQQPDYGWIYRLSGLEPPTEAT